MDDEQILARGGDEYEIAEYAKEHGATDPTNPILKAHREKDTTPIFNELWQNLWDFANANGTITLTAQQARELFDNISRDVATGEKRLREQIETDIKELCATHLDAEFKNAVLDYLDKDKPKKPTRIISKKF